MMSNLNQIPFVKVQNNGNDFIFLEHAKLTEFLPANKLTNKFYSDLARETCSPHFGIGADGLLIAELKDQNIYLKMYNPDGTEDYCGNGIFCAAHVLYTQDKIPSRATVIQFDNPSDIVIDPSGAIETSILPGSFKPEEVPYVGDQEELFFARVEILDSEFEISALNTGCTQAIIFQEEMISDHDFLKYSRAIENNRLFPLKTNVIWVVPENKHKLRMRIWERGVGETLSCGSGSAAVAMLWNRYKNISGELTVSSVGGDTLINVNDWQKLIHMKGNPQIVYEGSLTI